MSRVSRRSNASNSIGLRGSTSAQTPCTAATSCPPICTERCRRKHSNGQCMARSWPVRASARSLMSLTPFLAGGTRHRPFTLASLLQRARSSWCQSVPQRPQLGRVEATPRGPNRRAPCGPMRRGRIPPQFGLLDGHVDSLGCVSHRATPRGRYPIHLRTAHPEPLARAHLTPY